MNKHLPVPKRQVRLYLLCACPPIAEAEDRRGGQCLSEKAGVWNENKLTRIKIFLLF